MKPAAWKRARVKAHLAATIGNEAVDIAERKRMRAMLQEKEQLLSLLIENAPAAIAMFDKDMRHLAVSKRFLEDYRVADTNLIGRSHYEIFPEIPQRLRDFHLRCLAGETIRVEEDHFAHSDGTVVWGSWEIKPWYSRGEVGGILLFIEPLNERKEAEQRERRLTNIYRALSATNDAILHSSSEAVLFPMICRIAIDYGGMMLAWIGIPNAENRFVPAASYGKIAEDYLQGITIYTMDSQPEGCGPIGITYRENKTVVDDDIGSSEMMRPWREKAINQSLRSLSAFPVLRGGKPHAVLAVYSDQVGAFDEEIVQLLEEMAANISFALDNFDRDAARRQVEAALRESEERFRMLFENIPNIAVQGYDRERRVIYWNRASERLYGFTKEEARGKNLEDLIIPPEMRSAFIKAVHDWVTLGIAIPASELVLHNKEGREVHVFSNQAMQINISGEPEMYCIDIDLADLKKAEEDLQLAAMVYRNSSEAMMVMNASNKIIAVNPAFEHITGYSANEAIGKIPNILKATSQHDKAVYLNLRHALNSVGYWQGELWNRREGGELFAALGNFQASCRLSVASMPLS